MKKKIQKPFDAEAAKNGAKVETREGRSVRILCYDCVTDAYPIIGLVNYESVEHCFTYTIEGKVLISETSENDLVIIEEVEEAKFNVGDWVVSTFNSWPWLITAITSNCYELQDTQGHKTTVNQIAIDSYYRLWSLNDAKPGTVLCYKDGRPFMFKNLRDGYPVAYFGIDYEDSILIGNGLIWTKDSVRPATYEERQEFFNRIEEEGYEWDAESLTLTKKRWRDDKDKTIAGYFICADSNITYSKDHCNTKENYNLFATKKQAKSAITMARISQIMANDERFGGVVIDEEWNDSNCNWHVIARLGNQLVINRKFSYEFLAFHTKEQAELFLKENEDLVKDYYMM